MFHCITDGSTATPGFFAWNVDSTWARVFARTEVSRGSMKVQSFTGAAALTIAGPQAAAAAPRTAARAMNDLRLLLILDMVSCSLVVGLWFYSFTAPPPIPWMKERCNRA
ncbi:MAG: hypothetical protein IPI73_23305 [Betaproteobacteria bacterium]|nr:hypothetical protein [Betaproteobacteria bacterium]